MEEALGTHDVAGDAAGQEGPPPPPLALCIWAGGLFLSLSPPGLPAAGPQAHCPARGAWECMRVCECV